MPRSTDTQQLERDFFVACGMITYCKGTGDNPKKYVKQAEKIIKELKKRDHPNINFFEKALKERTG